MDNNREMPLKDQIIRLIKMVDDKDEKLLKHLLRIANKAVTEGRVE